MSVKFLLQPFGLSERTYFCGVRVLYVRAEDFSNRINKRKLIGIIDWKFKFDAEKIKYLCIIYKVTFKLRILYEAVFQ